MGWLGNVIWYEVGKGQNKQNNSQDKTVQQPEIKTETRVVEVKKDICIKTQYQDWSINLFFISLGIFFLGLSMMFGPRRKNERIK